VRKEKKNEERIKVNEERIKVNEQRMKENDEWKKDNDDWKKKNNDWCGKYEFGILRNHIITAIYDLHDYFKLNDIINLDEKTVIKLKIHTDSSNTCRNRLIKIYFFNNSKLLDNKFKSNSVIINLPIDECFGNK
jgi:hypothetical protein